MYKVRSKKGFKSEEDAIYFLLDVIAEAGLETEFEIVRDGNKVE